MTSTADDLPRQLPALCKPRFTSTHILRWLAAQQNWDKIHFDQRFCRDVAKLEAPVVNGALKQHWIVQFLAQGLPGAWPWRIDYQFVGPDFVGDTLRVQGAIKGSQVLEGLEFVHLDVEIFNIDRNQVTTRGHAVALRDATDRPILDVVGLRLPLAIGLNLGVSALDAAVPVQMNEQLGAQFDARESLYPVDLSRLRLFADAVIDLAPVHFDSQVGAASPWGKVVAPPLFPLHGIEGRPGSLPLSEDVRAQGREGVNEVGRDVASRFGLDAAGGMNAGNQVEIHSLARVGETIVANSTLVGVKRRFGKRGGDMFFFETLNRYAERSGRPLVTERQTVVLRLVNG